MSDAEASAGRWRACWERCRAVSRAIEGELLGWSLPPIPVALRETPIEADPPDRWCLRCGQSVGIGEATASGCGSCRGHPTRLAGTIRLAEYGGGVARRVLETKHARWHAMAATLGGMLGGQFDRPELRHWRPALLVPVPMPGLRRIWRGIDHADELARAIAASTGARVVRPLLQRLGATQVGRSPTERRRSQRRFRIKGGWTGRRMARALRRGGPVVIVDDVRTTGATLEEVARLLEDLGARSPIAAVVAVVPSPSRRGQVDAGPDPPRRGASSDRELTAGGDL